MQLGKKVEIFLDFIKTIRFKDGFNDAQLENRFLKETWLELTKEVGRFKEYLSEIKKEMKVAIKQMSGAKTNMRRKKELKPTNKPLIWRINADMESHGG